MKILIYYNSILCYNMKMKKGLLIMLSFIDILKTHYDLLIYFFIGLIFVFFFVIIFLINNKKKKHSNRLEELKAIIRKLMNYQLLMQSIKSKN